MFSFFMSFKMAGQNDNFITKESCKSFSVFYMYHFQMNKMQGTIMEPRFEKPLFNEVLNITNDTLHPDQNNNYSKMCEIEPQYNEPRYNKFLDIMNIIWKPKRKIDLNRTNYNVNS